MKEFILLDTSDRVLDTFQADSIDDVEGLPKFKEVMKKQKGRLYTIVEVAQTKRYVRPL
jgi:hypothetical protein